jgi:predicted ribosome quality control (RQC) complex YloA/Tae2 family protein
MNGSAVSTQKRSLPKIYQYGQGEKQFLFEIYVSTKGDFWLQIDSGAMFLAQHKKIAPMTPPNFCMFLRKHLNGKAIKNIRQIGFDRIVEIMTDSSILILEFVPPGNVVLCDRFYNVIMPMHVQRWRDRSILPKKPYRYPPGPVNPYNISLDIWSHMLQKQTGTIKSVLARMGFGSLYAGEVISRAKVDAERQAGQLSPEETSALYQAARMLGERKAEPVSYEDGIVSPFPLSTKKEQIKGKWSRRRRSRTGGRRPIRYTPFTAWSRTYSTAYGRRRTADSHGPRSRAGSRASRPRRRRLSWR